MVEGEGRSNPCLLRPAPLQGVQMRLRRIFPVLALAGLLVTPAFAQDNTTGTPLEVGVMAPDFELPGATRHGPRAIGIALVGPFR